MSAAEVLDLTDHRGCEEATEVLELAGPWWVNARSRRGGRVSGCPSAARYGLVVRLDDPSDRVVISARPTAFWSQ